MTKSTAAGRKDFLTRLADARNRPATFFSTLWASRWPLFQWFFVFAVATAFFAATFGPRYAETVLAIGVGLLLGMFVQLRQSTRYWPWLVQIIDWQRVEQQLAEGSQPGA